jgi:small subunit ribosomal protein S17
MKADQIRELSMDEIRARLAELEEERFRLRFRGATEALSNPLRLRTIRRDIARLQTVLREKADTVEATRSRAREETKMAETEKTNPAARTARKVRQGLVVSDKMDKTVVVAIERRVPHPVYGKMVTKTKRLKAHDEANSAKVGDTVRIVETRPLSKDKRFRLLEIVERAR